jgi:hypothetical protein
MRDSMTGPLGIFFITSKTAKLGLAALLHLIAVLSVSHGDIQPPVAAYSRRRHIFLLGLEKIREEVPGRKSRGDNQQPWLYADDRHRPGGYL